MEVLPVAVASVLPAFRWPRTCWISFEPFFYFVGVKLFAPQHARERLALPAALVLGHVWRAELRLIEAIGFRLAQCEDLQGIGERLRRQRRAQPQYDAARLAGLQLEDVVRGSLRT